MRLVSGRFTSVFLGHGISISQVAVVTVAAMIVVGCSTTSQRSAGAAVGENEQSPGPYRGLASVHDEEELRRDFDQFIRSEDPIKAIGEKIDRISRIHFRAQSYLKEFDQKLEEAVNAQANGVSGVSPVIAHDSYAKLVAAWFITEDLRAKVVHTYERLAELTAANAASGIVSSDAVILENAKRARVAFREALKEKSGGAKAIALQSLFLDLSRTKAAKNPEGNGDVLSTSKFASGKLSDVNREIKQGKQISSAEQAKKINDYQLEVRKALADDEITNEIESLVPAVKYEVLSNLLNRDPAAKGQIYPDPGPNGNLTGSTFKAGTWALTYDDGPHPKHTAAILSELNRHKIKATFFWLARNVEGYKKIVESVKKSRMGLGNHSFTHANLPNVSPQQLEHEIIKSSEAEARVYGFRPRIFRCPYGACGGGNSLIRNMIANQGMVHIFWNIDSLDWQDRDPKSIYERVTKQMQLQNRGIILFHDIHQQSVDASKVLIQHLAAGVKSNAYRVLTVEEAIKELNRN